MVGITLTPNLKLSKLPANYHVWAQIMNDNLTMVDAAITGFITFNNLRGAWANSTAYAVGDTVSDSDSAVLYTALVAHTSSTIPTTFLEERIALPTYWNVTNAAATTRGAWTGPGTAYNVNDFVLADGTKYAMCLVQHVSGVSYTVDLALGRWATIIDLSVVGSLVLPVLTPADANKFVGASATGSGYIVFDGAEAMARLAGLLPVTKGGTGVGTSTGTGSVVLSDSPVFAGNPTAPTPVTADNDTSIATTAYVQAQAYITATALAPYATLNSPALTGNPTAPTPTPGDSDTSIATTAFVATSFAPLASPALTGNPTAPTATVGDNDTSIATTAFVTAAVSKVGATRQTVAAGPIDTGGLPTFLPNTNAALSITTQNVSGTAPLVATAANGWLAASGFPDDRIGFSTANITWSGLTLNRAAATPNFLYATISGGVLTTASTIVTPVYQRGGTPAVTSGLITFNINEMKAYLGNGVTAPQTYLVLFGEAATDATTVISTVAYAYWGRYESAFTTPLPGVATFTSANHNLGVYPQNYDFVVECTTTDNGYLVGDQMRASQLSISNAAFEYAPGLPVSNKTIGIQVGPSSGFAGAVRTGGTAFALAGASWKYKFIAERGW